jgi:hypothetical protein
VSRLRRSRPTRGCLAVGALLGVLAFVSVIGTIIVTAIWPGEMKLTGPLFCPDDRPDAYVVVDSYSPVPGETHYEFTLYCMGPRGEVTDAGYLRPMAALTLFHALLVVALVIAFILWLRLRLRRARRSDSPAP